MKDTKIVLLEELAANFQLKTPDAIDRLQKLVQEGDLTGNKLIFIPLCTSTTFTDSISFLKVSLMIVANLYAFQWRK